MDAAEPRVRRRGFFLHSDTGEAESPELDNPEGFVVRVRTGHPAVQRRPVSRFTSGRSRSTSATAVEEGPEIRSGSVTGSRQRAHSPR